MLDSLPWVLAGCVLGLFTGLFPGIHVNTLSILILLIAKSNDINFALLIVSTSIVHSFVDFIPSIALGAPDSGNFLSVLPGHRMLLEGEGFYAVKLTILGGLFGGIASLLMAPIFVLFVSRLIQFIYGLIPAILIIVLALMVLGEKRGKRKWAIAVIVLSSIMGLLSLRILPMQNTLLPLVTGFFGAATLIDSINKEQKIGKQKTGEHSYGKRMVLEGSLLSALAGAIVSLLPSLGPSQAAFIIRKFTGKISQEKYLVILGGINTANMMFSFLCLYLIGKARTGPAVAVKQLIELDAMQLGLIFAAMVISIGLGAIIAEIAAKKLFTIMHRFNYRAANIVILVLLAVLSVLLSGAIGFLVFSVASFIGLAALSSKIRRTNCMAFLMVPTILFYLGL